jgi:hypothetical protein
MRLSTLMTGAAIAVVSGLVVLSQASGKTRIGNFEGDPLNPEVYRAQIVAVDAVLFEDGKLAESDREDVANTLVVMGRFAAADTTNTIAKTLGQNMRTLGAMVKHTKVGTPLLNSRLRREWLRIRSSLFDDAWWFRRSSADPIMPAVAGPPLPSTLRAANAEERAGLDQTLFSLGYLLNYAKRDLANDYDTDPHRQFVMDAEAELALDVERLGPVPPRFGIDLYYQDAYNDAAEAIRNMKTLVGLGTGAPTSSREYVINKVEEHLGQAREAVGRMQ